MNDDTDSRRWFTGASDGHILVDFTATERATIAAILDFARDPTNDGHELMHCIDTDGTRVIDMATGRGRVDLTEKMNSAIVAKEPVRLWHNHPSQDSLSHQDWKSAATTSSLEIVALNDGGSIFVGRIREWRNEIEDVLRQSMRIAADLEFKMSNFAKAANMDIDHLIAFSKRTSHVLNLAMARCQVAEYAYHLSDENRDNIQIAENLGTVAMGLDFATSEITKILSLSVDSAAI